MFYISEIKKETPIKYKTDLQQKVFDTLTKLNINFERVDTDEAITMDDCTDINKKMNMKMVKTLFLCNRQQTEFYLFITISDKSFSSKEFSHILGISRVSFAPVVLMNSMLHTDVGAATIFSTIIDNSNQVKIVMDKDVVNEKWYGCSDGTTTGYLKIRTYDIINVLLKYTNHMPTIIEI